MANKYTTPITTLLCSALMLASGLLRADDTEIYIGNGGNGSAIPLVFFYIEYTPNLASTICTNVHLDNPLTTVNEDNVATACPQIAPIKTYMSPNDLSSTDTTIDQFELTRAALKRVLIAMNSGIKVGLLMAHDNLSSCAGGPGVADGCSQGGYILKGLTAVENPSTGFNPASATSAQLKVELDLKPGKKALFQKLDALISPQGGFSHEHQNKEVYFELFRYLTGQGIYNGKNGWVDYGTNKSFNLGAGSSTTFNKVPAGITPYICASLNIPACYDAAFLAGMSNGTSRWVVAPAKLQPNDTVFTGDFAAVGNSQYMHTIPLMRDVTIEQSGNINYKPGITTACEKVYVINVVDGGGNSANDADTAIKASLASGGMNFNLSNSDTGFEQMVKWLYDKDLADGTFGTAGNILGTQNVTSYFIAKQPQQVDQAAQYGGTGYAIPLTSDAQSVVDAITKIFRGIIDASTTFTAAAIPVNVFNRSEVIDNAYIALFQPNKDSQPSWVGNVKKLKMEIYQQCNLYDTVDPTKCLEWVNRLRLVDSLRQDAISASTGRIIPQALTYWTRAGSYDLLDNISTSNGESEVAGRDGRTVYRGGAGHQIPNMLSADGLTPGSMNWTNSPSGRLLYTTADSGSTPMAIEWSNIASLWPSIYNTTTTTNYPVAAQWPTVYSAAATTATLSNDWSRAQSLYTQDPGVSSTLTKPSYATGTPTSVNASTYTVKDMASKVLAYMRGFDVNDGNINGDFAESRRWLFGDTLHSRPLPINYGARNGYSQSNPDIRLIAGSNDGYLRMLRNTYSDGSESGKEVWAFMPREAMKIQKQLMDNNQDSLPDHPYGVDGAPSVYVHDRDGTIGTCTEPNAVNPCDDSVAVFFGMRRGGRAYYGLDITDPDAAPTVLWRITAENTTYRELGYSFAQPSVRGLKWGSFTKARPVVIIGGGYDSNKDIDNPLLGTDDTMGRAIYIIDAQTGALVWKATGNSADTTGDHQYVAEMRNSIPSEVMAIDSTGDGSVDRIYVGDTGGRVWRVDLPGTDVAQWKATLLMDLGRHVTADGVNDRRFFYPPDVVPTSDSIGDYDAVVIASGNREHPRQTQTSDYLIVYKDRYVADVLPSGFSAATMNSFVDVTNSVPATTVSTGWKLRLVDLGEKSLSSVMTMQGVVYLSTYVPTTAGSSTTACLPSEGTGYLYAVSLANGSAVYDYNSVTGGNERRRQLKSPGIPAESVYISFHADPPISGPGTTPPVGGGTSVSGGGGVLRVNCILASDMTCGNDVGRQQWSTYWFEKQK